MKTRTGQKHKPTSATPAARFISSNRTKESAESPIAPEEHTPGALRYDLTRIPALHPSEQSRPSKLTTGEASEVIQPKSIPGKESAVDHATERLIDDMRGSGGRPLPDSERAFFEPRFGRDFGDVRLHTDSRAQEAARSVNAKAFTLGRDIAFGAGEYAPGTSAGRRLLAHELTHTVQSSTEPKAKQGGEGRISRESEPLDSNSKELLSYLKILDDTGKISGKSGVKALHILERWKRGDSAFILDTKRKILLFKEIINDWWFLRALRKDIALLNLLRGLTDIEFFELVQSLGQEKIKKAMSYLSPGEVEKIFAERKSALNKKPRDNRRIFDTKTIMDLEEKYRENALLGTNRKDCITILNSVAPRLFNIEKRRFRKKMGKVPTVAGRWGWTMETFSNRLKQNINLAKGPHRVRFSLRKKDQRPDGYKKKLPSQVFSQATQKRQGWHIFGLAVMNSVHTAAIFVDIRADTQFYYWADQLRGFALIGKTSGEVDNYIQERTSSLWDWVLRKKGKKWDSTLFIWQYFSR